MVDHAFDQHATRYDQWYDNFPNTFACELSALRCVLPQPGLWVEIGVGTGRFAAALGISLGIDPAPSMAALARQRGIDVIEGIAEALPLASESIDCAFFITVLCFVTDLKKAIEEAARILRPGGSCIIGMLRADSPLGQALQATAQDDVFFRSAHLRDVDEVIRAVKRANLHLVQSAQSLFGPPEQFESHAITHQAGHHRGSFVALRAIKRS